MEQEKQTISVCRPFGIPHHVFDMYMEMVFLPMLNKLMTEKGITNPENRIKVGERLLRLMSYKNEQTYPKEPAIVKWANQKETR